MKLSKTSHWEHDYKLHKYTQNVIDNIIKYFNDNNLYCYIELEYKIVTTREHFWLSREIVTGIQILFHHPHKKLISYYDYDKYAQNIKKRRRRKHTLHITWTAITTLEDLVDYYIQARDSGDYNENRFIRVIHSNFSLHVKLDK